MRDASGPDHQDGVLAGVDVRGRIGLRRRLSAGESGQTCISIPRRLAAGPGIDEIPRIEFELVRERGDDASVWGRSPLFPRANDERCPSDPLGEIGGRPASLLRGPP